MNKFINEWGKQQKQPLEVILLLHCLGSRAGVILSKMINNDWNVGLKHIKLDEEYMLELFFASPESHN